MVYFLCLIVGIVASFTGSLLGLGGGIILIPTMLYLQDSINGFSWVTPQSIVGISLITMVFTALSSTIAYGRDGRIDYRTGFIILCGSIPGGMLGSWINQFIQSEQFLLYFGSVVILLALLMFIKRDPEKAINKTKNSKNLRSFVIDGQKFEYTVPVLIAVPVSVIVGLLSGLFGIGGGAVIVPVMILIFMIPPHIAIATSMFMILVTSFFSSLTHVFLGHIAWLYLLFIIPGAWIGGTLGAKVNQRLKSSRLEALFRGMLILIGIKLILDGLAV